LAGRRVRGELANWHDSFAKTPADYTWTTSADHGVREGALPPQIDTLDDRRLRCKFGDGAADRRRAGKSPAEQDN
jgi:hypothetical protein